MNYILFFNQTKVSKLKMSDFPCLLTGIIDSSNLPDDIISLFTKYEEAVEGNMLTIVEDLESCIEELKFSVVDERNGSHLKISDFQYYPSTGKISVRIE